MPQPLVEVARYASPVEAALVRGLLEEQGFVVRTHGEVAAGTLWHMGPGVAGVRLLVTADVAEEARELIEQHASRPTEEADERDGDPDDELDDDFSEDWADDDLDEDEVVADPLPDELIRAWRAAVIGIGLLPPLLSLYSLWLLFKNDFFSEQSRNWRMPAALAINVLVIAAVVWFVLYVDWRFLQF